jgi:copper(I)-binding protein
VSAFPPKVRRWHLVVVLVAGVVVGGCASANSGASSASRVVARVGRLEIIDPFLPDPPSPSVAAVYVTIRNTGSTADALIEVSSPAASTSMLMTEDEQGSVGAMAMLKELRVPPHTSVSLAPGKDHAMLEDPREVFKVGETVPVTMRFVHAGSVTVHVPVVPLDRILTPSGADGSAGADATTGGSMSNMPGMSRNGG